MCKFKRATTMALACAMLLSLLPMAVPKASAASSSTLANVTETYVDASDGSEVSKAETYSVTHKERSPQKIADYTYQDYSESVERVYSHKDLNYIYGYPDKPVRPDRPMSRGEAAAVFYRLYDGSYPDAKRGMSENTFSDLDKSLWCYKEVEMLYNIGSINGYGDGTLRPNAPVTRAEFAAWAARWSGLDYSGEAKFSDVTTDHWAYGEINAAVAAGWVDGYPDGTFKPDQNIERVEVMKLVNRMVNRSITTEALEKLGAVNPYTDLVTTHWGYPQVMEATIPHSGADWHGTSYNDGKFNVIIERFVDEDGKELAKTVISKGKDEATTKEGPGYNYLGYIRHITYVYKKGAAAPYITKSANVDETYEGKDIEYTVTIGNKKEAHAAWKNVTMTDKLPEGVKLVDGSVYLNKKSAEYTLKDGTLSVKVGDVAEGKEAVVTFKVNVQKGMAGKTIINTAVAKGDNGTAEDKSYTATDKGVIINQGDIKPSVEKKANKKNASVGDQITYTITASNAKDATYKITDAVVTDTLPQGLSFRHGSVQVNGTSAAYAYGEDDRQLRVGLGDIEPGESVKVTFAVEVTREAYGSTIKNVAVLSGSNIIDVSDEDEGIVIADGKTRPTLTKQASKKTAEVGDSITYTLTAGNAENATVAIENATITDILPQGLEFKSGSVQVNGKSVSGTIYDDETRTLTVPVGNIDVDASVKVSFMVTVTKDAYGKTIKNVAVLGSDNGPDVKAEDPGVNIGDGKAKPSIEKTSNKKEASVGDRIEYTLKVSNEATATVDLENPVITDVIPTGLDFVDGSVYVNGKASKDYNYSDTDRILTINLKNIAPDTTVEVKLSAKVNDTAFKTTIQNLATLTCDNGERKQDTDDGVIIPDGRAQLDISKVADNRTPKVGERVTYTMKVGNVAGAPVPARNVQVSDTIPEGLTFAGIVQIDGYSATYSFQDGKMVIPVGDIAAGYTRTVTAEFVVNENAYGKTITNVAVASADNAEDKPATDAGVNVPEGAPDGYVSQKTVSKSNAKVGDTLRYSFRLQNGAAATAAWENATITDTLPDGLSFAANVKMNGTSTTNYSWDEDSRTIVMTAPSIEAGQAVTFSFDVTVDEGMQGKYVVNTAIVKGPDGQPDIPVSDPGTQIDPGTVEPFSSKTANKDKVNVGETVMYTVEVGNRSSATAAWKDVVITDTLPDGVRLLNSVSANGAPVAFTADNGVLTAKLGNIAPGETLKVRYEVLVLEEAAGTTLKNTVVLSGPGGSSTSKVEVPVEVPEKPDNNDPLLPGEKYINKDVNKTTVKVGPGVKAEDRRVTYTVKVGNDSSKKTWEDVVLTDVLDSSMVTLISDSIHVDGVRLNSNQWARRDGVLTIELGDIQYGKEVEVRFDLEFKRDAGNKRYENIATATGTIDGQKVWASAAAPIVQVLDDGITSDIHYGIFYGCADSQGNFSGEWQPNRNIYIYELATTAYRIMTNDSKNGLLQTSGKGYVSDYIANHYSIETTAIVGAGILSSNEFLPSSGMVEGKDYITLGSEEDPVYNVYATRDQVGRVLKAVFGSDYGVHGSGYITRLEMASIYCTIQERDTTPNYREAQAAGMFIQDFIDARGNNLVTEVSHTHDYMKDSYGHETWMYNPSFTG